MGTNQLYYFLEIELLEKKSFEICDENQDGGLSWAEVDICEVCILTKKILKTSKSLNFFFFCRKLMDSLSILIVYLMRKTLITLILIKMEFYILKNGQLFLIKKILIFLFTT